MQKTIIACIILIIFSASAMGQESIGVAGVKASIEQQNLVIEIIAFNNGKEAGELKITTNYFGETDERKEIIPVDRTKKITYALHNIKPGKVKMAIENGIKKFVEITIPEDYMQNKELQVKEITSEDYYTVPEPEKKFDPIPIAFAIVIILIIILIMRSFFFKTGTEKQFAKNAELLKEADELKKEKKAQKIRVD